MRAGGAGASHTACLHIDSLSFDDVIIIIIIINIIIIIISTVCEMLCSVF